MFSKRLLCLYASLCAITTMQSSSPQQVEEPDATTESREPVAYVYVSFTPPNSSVNEIAGYAAAANGRLTPVPGSPTTADVTSMAVNGLYLFGSNQNGVDVDTYAIESNGALSLVYQTNVARYTSDDCGISGALFLDHTGHTLYDTEYLGDSCENNDYLSLGVVKKTGGLTNIGSGSASAWLSQPATFTGNNRFAYSVACLGDAYWAIFGLERRSNGLLTAINNFHAALPEPKAGDFYCPSQVAAGPTHHVAIALQPVDSFFAPDGGPQIGSFTVATNGDLATTNTHQDMPVSEVGTALSISMSPSGKLLAVGGSAGLQIFHFNGATPPRAAARIAHDQKRNRPGFLGPPQPSVCDQHAARTPPRIHHHSDGSPPRIAGIALFPGQPAGPDCAVVAPALGEVAVPIHRSFEKRLLRRLTRAPSDPSRSCWCAPQQSNRIAGSQKIEIRPQV